MAALPMLMQWWFNWMTLIVVLMPLLFIRRPQGRVALACAVGLAAVAAAGVYIFRNRGRTGAEPPGS